MMVDELGEPGLDPCYHRLAGSHELVRPGFRRLEQAQPAGAFRYRIATCDSKGSPRSDPWISHGSIYPSIPSESGRRESFLFLCRLIQRRSLVRIHALKPSSNGGKRVISRRPKFSGRLPERAPVPDLSQRERRGRVDNTAPHGQGRPTPAAYEPDLFC